jgi:hypothetical protein
VAEDGGGVASTTINSSMSHAGEEELAKKPAATKAAATKAPRTPWENFATAATFIEGCLADEAVSSC